MKRSLRRSRLLPRLRVFLSGALFLATLTIPVTPAQATMTFVISGRGYGHGIGLSQWGAKGYADKGWTYGAILRHFYQGTSVTYDALVSTGTVKVNLDPSANSSNGGYTRSSWTLSPGHSGGRLLVSGHADNLVPNAAYVFTPVGSSVKVRLASGTASFTVSRYVDVKERGLTTSLVRVAEGTGIYGRANQAHRGVLKLTPNNSSSAPRLKLVGFLPMDAYLYGVVPAESPSSWPREALRAQAVAARSYAKTTGGEMYCTTSHQAYLGFNGEAAATTQAVKDTAGRLVTYAGAVVKAFFFSSSGGHTANIEDVWSSAIPQPYYRGVDDADIGAGSSLAASWGTPIRYTDSALAAKLRSYDARDGVYQYTPQGTAMLTAISIGRADGDFARSVTMSWSGGAITIAKGDWFRAALGLRSTKFFISRESSTKRTEQNDKRVVYTSSWRTAFSTVHSGGSYSYSSRTSATATVRFNGTSLAIIGPRYPHFGRANVYVDGRYVRTISAYSATSRFKQRLFSATGLSSTTTHTVTVKVTGTRDAASKGVCFGLDAIDIDGGDTLVP